MSKSNLFAIINRNKQEYEVKRSYFFDLLSYLIAGFAGYYLNSVPIIGLLLSPFILFLLKVIFKKLPLSFKGFVWPIWFLMGIPATFWTFSFEEKYHIVTPLTKKYLTRKKAHGRFAHHFPININFSKEEAKINLYKYSVPEKVRLRILFFDLIN